MKITYDLREYLFYIYFNEENKSVDETKVVENCFLLINEKNEWVGIEIDNKITKKLSRDILWKNDAKLVNRLKQEMNLDFYKNELFGIEIILWNENRSIAFNGIKELTFSKDIADV